MVFFITVESLSTIESSTGALTVITAKSERFVPSVVVAVIVALPLPTPLTTPFSTVATLLSEEVHTTDLLVASSGVT